MSDDPLVEPDSPPALPAVEPRLSTGEYETLLRLQADVATLGREIPHLNAVIDRLHAANEKLRQGEAEALLQPLFRDLIKMADDWSARARSWASRTGASADDVAQACREAAEDAQLMLERHGVEGFLPEAGAAFDRRLQRAVDTEPTTEAEADGRIAVTRRSGYRHGERVLRPAEVVVHRYRPAPVPDGSED